MEEEIFKLFKNKHEIKPDSEFLNRSKRLILMSHQNNQNIMRKFKNEFSNNLNLVLGLSLTVVVALITVGGFIYLNTSNGGLAETFNGNFKKEAEAVDFQIQLKEVKYFSDSAKEIAALLHEIKTPE